MQRCMALRLMRPLRADATNKPSGLRLLFRVFVVTAAWLLLFSGAQQGFDSLQACLYCAAFGAAAWLCRCCCACLRRLTALQRLCTRLYCMQRFVVRVLGTLLHKLAGRDVVYLSWQLRVSVAALRFSVRSLQWALRCRVRQQSMRR